ncbi:hypothetical protein QOT17_019304 [Balamuthia mandrillaris]
MSSSDSAISDDLFSDSESETEEDIKKREEYVKTLEREVQLLKKLKYLERKREALEDDAYGDTKSRGRTSGGDHHQRQRKLSRNSSKEVVRRASARDLKSNVRHEKNTPSSMSASSSCSAVPTKQRPSSVSYGTGTDKGSNSSSSQSSPSSAPKARPRRERQQSKYRGSGRDPSNSITKDAAKKEANGGERTNSGSSYAELAPLSELLESASSKQIATEAVVLQVSDTIEHALQTMATTHKIALPVFDKGTLCGMLEIYDIIEFVLDWKEKESGEASGSSRLLVASTKVDDLLKGASRKPLWYRSAVSPQDSLLVVANNFTRDLQEVPILHLSSPSSTDENTSSTLELDLKEQQVVSQPSFLSFLFKHSNSNAKLETALKENIVNSVRYLSCGAVVATSSTPFTKVFRDMARSKVPVVAIVKEGEDSALDATLEVHAFERLFRKEKVETNELAWNATLTEFCNLTNHTLLAPLSCLPTTSLSEALKLMMSSNNSGGPHVIWIVNEKLQPKELLTLNEVLQFLLISEKKRLEGRKAGTRKTLAMTSRACRKSTAKADKEQNTQKELTTGNKDPKQTNESEDSDFSDGEAKVGGSHKASTSSVPSSVSSASSALSPSSSGLSVEQRRSAPSAKETSGWLNKRSPAFHKQWQRRWFVLRDNEIKWFKDPKDETSCGDLVLDATVKLYETKDVNGFALRLGKRKYTLSAETEMEKTSWMNALHHVFDNIRIGLYDHI